VSRHRADTRPRWGRIGLASVAALVTLVAMLGGLGLFSGPGDDPMAADPAAAASAPQEGASSGVAPSAAASSSVPPVSAAVSAGASASGSASGSASAVRSGDATALPPNSGSGRRAVFDQRAQRVWIVDADGTVERTYPVSGSSEDNLRPGTYHVYGKSRWAVGIDDSGVMQYFVRFAHGNDNGASIGFHTIPTKDGKPLQTVAQLGTPLSHGCIRQKTDDAIAMWDFASVGTTVVVVA